MSSIKTKTSDSKTKTIHGLTSYTKYISKDSTKKIHIFAEPHLQHFNNKAKHTLSSFFIDKINDPKFKGNLFLELDITKSKSNSNFIQSLSKFPAFYRNMANYIRNNKKSMKHRIHFFDVREQFIKKHLKCNNSPASNFVYSHLISEIPIHFLFINSKLFIAELFKLQGKSTFASYYINQNVPQIYSYSEEISQFLLPFFQNKTNHLPIGNFQHKNILPHLKYFIDRFRTIISLLADVQLLQMIQTSFKQNNKNIFVVIGSNHKQHIENALLSLNHSFSKVLHRHHSNFKVEIPL